MATNNFAAVLHRRTNRISRVLIYAVLEWTLISLLLLNSLFSLLIHKFARYFGLKPPCIFCSRLDHHFVQPQKNKGYSSSFSLEIICEQHAVEISKIGYCSHHRKLVESQSMCFDCSSSSSSSAQDAAVFRWMREIGIVRTTDDDGDGDVVKKCSCCDGIIQSSSLDQNTAGLVINQREQVGSDSDPKFGYEILDDDDDDYVEENEEEVEEKERDVGTKPEKQPLLNSDENEDEDDDNNVVNSKEIVTDRSINLCPDMLPQHLEFYIDHDDYRLIPVDLADSMKVKKEVNLSHDQEDSKEFELVFEGDELLSGCLFINKENLSCIMEEEEEAHRGGLVCADGEVEDEGRTDEGSSPTMERESEEKMRILQPHLEENKIEERSLANLQEEVEEEEKVESKIDERNLPNAQEREEKADISQMQQEERENNEKSVLPLQEEDEEKEKMEILQPHMEESKIEERTLSNLQDQEEVEERNVEEDSVISMPIEEEKTEIENAAHLQVQEENAAAESAHTLQLQEERDRVIEPNEMASVTSEDKQTELGELEAVNNRETVAETSEKSLKVNVSLSQNEVEIEEERVPDTPSSVESLHTLHKKLLLLGRRESATEESLDGSIISEHEVGDGAATMEKLKSVLQSERKALRALYKELEEERSASAIAANQTMAMINRLQEEKATMHMEALQYQRMLEEQSEYDQEALQMMNELMVKREKEKQELEKELEVLRKKVMDYEERERIRVLARRREGSMRSRNSSASCSYGEESDGLSIDLNHDTKDHEEDGVSPHSHEVNGHQDTPSEAVLGLQESLASFEEERQAILEQLKTLEEKLFTLAEEEEEHSDNMKPFEQFYEENGKEFDANGDDNGFSHTNGKHQQERKLNGSMQKRLLPLFDATELIESPDGELLEGKEVGFEYLDLNKSPITKFELEKKRLAIEEEVDHVYERLQALEADREFLKHCIGSLRKGDKGLDLLQEILQHLRDLKNVELQAMKNMDHCASV